jgi:hypothetical protein
MRLCIIDPAHNLPGLTRLFPEADYYAHEPDNFFNYSWTCHMQNHEFEGHYGFRYKTDWSTITSDNYDYVFIVFTVYDAYGKQPYQHAIATAMLERVYSLIRSQQFKCVALFDTHDYPYDPNQYPGQPVNIFFKRNYSNKITYASNVIPFPISMFVKPCILWSMLTYTESAPLISQQKIMDAIWIGRTYTLTHTEEGIVRDRTGIHEQIKPYIISYTSLPYNEYIDSLRKYAICVDLIGVGDPNKRTVEILTSGALWMSNINELNWGFSSEDRFSELCTFTDGNDFLKKKTLLLENPEVYQAALEQQDRLVRKYFNRDTMRNLIENTIIRFNTSANTKTVI